MGFIDGTIQRTCRPSRYQDQAYSGHKNYHGIKFQNITMANGLIVQMYGPLEGRHHDSFMLEDSVVVEDMACHAGYHLYGDQGYPVRGWLITPFANARRTPEQLRFNRDLRRARIAVEWSFGWIACYWIFFSLVDNMKVFKSPIGAMFVIATFFTNCISCARRRNQASKCFRWRQPTLEIYLADLLHQDVNEADYLSDDDDQFFLLRIRRE
jgi:nuclease HARBI1